MLLGLLALIGLPFLVLGWLIGAAIEGAEQLMNWLYRRREARSARIEADLDRTQDELRATILRLAGSLGVEAHEARRALIRESYLATGRVLDKPE